MKPDGFVTPEELDALAEKAAYDCFPAMHVADLETMKDRIRAAIDQALSLQRESVIETQLDAQRYRRLRSWWTYIEWTKALGRPCNSPKDIDAAIDAI